MIFGNQTHLEMLTTLLDNKVEFLIVGGYAVVLHGYVKTTDDMDLWINHTPENRKRLFDTFSQLQFDPEGIEMIRNLDMTNTIVFYIGEAPDRIDFFIHLSGVHFNYAYGRCEILSYPPYKIPYLHLDDLIVNKLRSNRLQDLADVEELQKIARPGKI